MKTTSQDATQKKRPGRPSKKVQQQVIKKVDQTKEDNAIDDVLTIPCIYDNNVDNIEEPEPNDPYQNTVAKPFQDLSQQYSNNSQKKKIQLEFSENIYGIPDYLNEQNNINQWPQFTGVCCSNCVHQFSSQPIGIPKDFKDGKYIMDKEVFCCFECATSYLLNRVKSEKFEKYSLLCQLAKDMGYVHRLEPAPPTSLLKCFGGPYSVEEYREISKKISNQSLVLTIQPPPMIPQQMIAVEKNNTFSYNTSSCISSQNQSKRQKKHSVLHHLEVQQS